MMCITKIDFADNIKNMLSRSNEKGIFKCLNCSNCINNKKCKYKIVIKSSVSNVPIFY